MNIRNQRFLFLQGLASPFFGELAKDLRSRGAEVSRVNFRGGDKLWWPGPATDFGDCLPALPDFYEDLFCKKAFTDVVLFGDTRPVHAPVHEVASRHGARVHVFEEGYIRPDWVTVEREGVNLKSPLPQDPEWYRQAACELPPEPESASIHVPISLRALQDLAYRLASALDPAIFPHYRTHRPRHAAAEYAGWVSRFSRFPLLAPIDGARLERSLATDGPIFLLPLQLNGDSQIVHNSHFPSIAEVIRQVVKSFAQHAPANARLIVKNHPLDPGLDGHDSVTKRASRDAGVSDRVCFLETISLAKVFPHISGVVLVNSTAGLSAIWRGIPVHPLANPVYHMPGLTNNGSLAEFWEDPQPPEPDLYRDFRRVLLHVNHINGDYFTARGIALAVAGSHRFFRELSPLEELLLKVPLKRTPVSRALSNQGDWRISC